jgi:hypothetical protein
VHASSYLPSVWRCLWLGVFGSLLCLFSDNVLICPNRPQTKVVRSFHTFGSKTACKPSNFFRSRARVTINRFNTTTHRSRA